MSFVENFPDWINMFIIAPLGFALLKMMNHSSRITKLETTHEFYVEKVEKICKSNEDLAKQVNQMIGKLDVHLKNNRI